jgi:hypothetical protein
MKKAEPLEYRWLVREKAIIERVVKTIKKATLLYIESRRGSLILEWEHSSVGSGVVLSLKNPLSASDCHNLCKPRELSHPLLDLKTNRKVRGF